MNAVVERPDIPAPQPAQALMQVIERAALDPQFDVAKLEHLLAVKERWDAAEAKKAFVAALAGFKSDPPELFKNRHVEFTTSKGTTSYDHATLDHISSEIGKALAKHGLSHRWNVEQLDGGMIRVTCILTHERGHSETVAMSASRDESGSKNNIQALGSTVTYLQRYTLLAATGMAAKGQDDDGAGSGDEPKRETRPPVEQPRTSSDVRPGDDKPMNEGQLRILRAKLEHAGLKNEDLIEKFGPMSQLRFSQFNDIQQWIAGGGKS